MKKIIFLAAALFLIPCAAYAGIDGRTDKGVWAREGMVLGRGLLNIPGTVVEVFATPFREPAIHPKAWPITGLIRIPTNVIIRAVSAVNDLVVYPWVVPFTDDLSPFTEPMDLPEYAWSRV